MRDRRRLPGIHHAQTRRGAPRTYDTRLRHAAWPRSFVWHRHDGPTGMVNATFDSDHVPLGAGRCLHARDLDDPADFLPMSALVVQPPPPEPCMSLARAIPRHPAPSRAILACSSIEQNKRVAWPWRERCSGSSPSPSPSPRQRPPPMMGALRLDCPARLPGRVGAGLRHLANPRLPPIGRIRRSCRSDRTRTTGPRLRPAAGQPIPEPDGHSKDLRLHRRQPPGATLPPLLWGHAGCLAALAEP